MSVVTIEYSDDYPVSLSDARVQCMVDEDLTDEDYFLQGLIAAATDFCENYLGRSLRVVKKRYNGCFSETVDLFPDLVSVEKVTYIGSSGAVIELASNAYYVDRSVLIGCIVPASSWPQVKVTHPSPVVIDFTAGFQNIPKAIERCILLLVGHWFHNCDAMGDVSDELSRTVDNLLFVHKVQGF